MNFRLSMSLSLGVSIRSLGLGPQARQIANDDIWTRDLNKIQGALHNHLRGLLIRSVKNVLGHIDSRGFRQLDLGQNLDSTLIRLHNPKESSQMIWVKYDVMAPSIAMMSTVDSLKKLMSPCSFFLVNCYTVESLKVVFVVPICKVKGFSL